MNDSMDRYLRITSQQLRCFEAAARLLSVTRAAQQLHVTQPTVSVQLRDLADAVGEPLLDTSRRRVRLTQAGEALLATIGDIRDCWQRFDTRSGEIRGLLRGRLRIAAVTTAEYFVPDLLGPFAAAHPGIDIQLAVENRDRVVERLARGVDDITVMMVPPAHLPLMALPFIENPLVIIAAATHPFVGRRLRLASLKDERWLMREPGSGTRMETENHFAHAGFTPTIAMSLGSNEALKHAVSAGLGMTVISQLAVQSEIAAAPGAAKLAILRVVGFPLRRRWSLVWRKDAVQTVAARRLIEDLRSAGMAKAGRPRPVS